LENEVHTPHHVSRKFSNKSSTESELVAIDDAMAQILWKRHLLAEQGVPVHVTMVYRDNKKLSYYQKMGRHPVEASGCAVFLCYRPDQMRGGEGCILPYGKHAGRFLHQATSRCRILVYARAYT